MSERRPSANENDAAIASFEAMRDEVAELRREVARLNLDLSRLRAEGEEKQAEMGTYLALVAHQLKGPLLPLDVSRLTISRAIEHGAPLPEDTFPRALRQTRRIGRLIESLLVDLPHAEEGTLRAAMTSFDLREPVERAVADAQLMLEARTFSFNAPECEARVQGDPERIEQIVGSLLDNAVKYSPPEAPIEVRLCVDRAYAIVSVTDRGIGIPSRELGQVFTKFYRGSNAPSYLYRGLGVGLYLAHHLAKLFRGYLSLESVEGEGTVCRLHVPVGG